MSALLLNLKREYSNSHYQVAYVTFFLFLFTLIKKEKEKLKYVWLTLLKISPVEHNYKRITNVCVGHALYYELVLLYARSNFDRYMQHANPFKDINDERINLNSLSYTDINFIIIIYIVLM